MPIMADHSDATKRHAHMVDDPARTEPLCAAIAAAVRPGMRVLEIGTGTGVLAIAAAKAGAAEVIAIDVDSEALAAAEAAARKAGAADCIDFREELSFELALEERADLLLCETVGSFAFDENILATLADARERLLKPAGAIMPQRLELWGAPIAALPALEEPAMIARVEASSLIAAPERIAAVDFQEAIPECLETTTPFRCARADTVRAFALWPVATWWEGHRTDAAPTAAPTHWRQGILPIEERAVKRNEAIALDFCIGPHPDEPLLQTERLWRWSADR